MSRETKIVKLNYKADESTVNGRIYKKEDIEKAFNNTLKRHEVPIVRNCDELYRIDSDTGIHSPIVCFKDIIGFFEGYEIKEDGEINIKVKPIIDTELFDGYYNLSTCIMGEVRKDCSVDINIVIGFFICGNTDIINSEGVSI